MSVPTEVEAGAPTWPDLTLAEWPDTLYLLHRWFQIVGKLRLALEPMVNHWWQVPLYVSGWGLTTSPMHTGAGALEAEFDFVDQQLRFRTSDGRRREVPLESCSVSSFYDAVFEILGELKVPVHVLSRPVELVDATPFPDDDRRHTYDPAAARRFWLALLQAHRVMTTFRGRFIGKASPVHFFWGAADLATTRFSGRRAPLHPGGVPNCADWVQVLAYSHELSSCGFWPGGSEEGSFYAYAYPQPEGFAEWPVRPDDAYYDAELGEFILPYRAVRLSPDPDGALLSFFQTTYDAAAELAHWDRRQLEVGPDTGVDIERVRAKERAR